MKHVISALLLATSTSALGLTPSLNCPSIFESKPSFEDSITSAINKHGPLRGEVKKEDDWKDDRVFARMLSESEKFGRVQSQWDAKLGTRLYSTSTGLPDASGRIPLIDPDAKAVVVFFHGSGTTQSGGANFVGNMNRLANLGYAGLSFDMPFHSEGPIKDQFNNMDYFMKWVDQVVSRARVNGQPVYLFGHSFGPEVISEYLKRYPYGADGADLVSMVGFNDVLNEWQETKTEKMKFGGIVPENTLGGYWAGTISEQMTWNKEDGSPRATDLNPKLKIEILWGDSEEYAPAPIGGKSKTPIGKNTYDLTSAVRPFYPTANVSIARNIGHYIFDHVGADGKNSVMSSLYRLVGFKGDEKTVTVETDARFGARPYYVQFQQLFAIDSLFRSWLKSTHQLALATALSRSPNNKQSEKLIQDYKTAYKERVNAVRYGVTE